MSASWLEPFIFTGANDRNDLSASLLSWLGGERKSNAQMSDGGLVREQHTSKVFVALRLLNHVPDSCGHMQKRAACDDRWAFSFFMRGNAPPFGERPDTRVGRAEQ